MTVLLYHCITFYDFLYFYMLLMRNKWMDIEPLTLTLTLSSNHSPLVH